MTDHIVRAEAKTFATRAALPWLVAVGVYALLLLVAHRLLNDPDTYSQIATGRWIFAHAAVPHADPFSFTMQGTPWTAVEWLAQLIYAGAFALAGWTGVVVLAAGAVALAFGLLTHFLMRTLAPSWALIFVLAALSLAASHMLARPHVLVLPLMVAWAAALVGAMDRQAGPPYWALPLLLLWANLHGSAIVGIGLIGPAVLEALLQAGSRREWPRIILRWLPFSILALAVACVTPYGPHSLLMPLKMIDLGGSLNRVVEWRPQDFGHLGAFELLLLLGIFALSRGVTLPLVRALVLLGLLHFALAHTRMVDLLAMLAPLYLAQPLARQLGAADDTQAGSPTLARGIGLAAIAVVILATAFVAVRRVSPDPHNTPAAAIAAADLAHAGPVLNDYDFGGYLIFKGIPTFIDGRDEVYGAKFMAQYNRDISLADLPGFLHLLDRYHIRATLLSPATPAVALLDRLPVWKRVYADDVAVVHERRDASH